MYVCTIEPRANPRDLTASEYKRIQNGVSRRIIKQFAPYVIHFCSSFYQAEMSSDGVHFTELGKGRVREKFLSAIGYEIEESSE